MFGKRFLNEQPGGTNGAAGSAVGSAATNGMLHGGPAHSIKYEYEANPPVAGLHDNTGNGIDHGAMGGPALSKDHHPYGPGAYSVDFSLRTPLTSHEIVQHNHTYTLPHGTGSLPHLQQRDKKISTSSSTKTTKSPHNSSSDSEEDAYMTRDGKRARAMNIPISVSDIINLPIDAYCERLSKYDLSENQMSLIRDIRRRGKNKVAAQNFRKRREDEILSLDDEVKQLRRRKEELQSQRDRLFTERKRVLKKSSALRRHIFQFCRDPEGNPFSPTEYSLQQTANGSVYVVPRDAANMNDTNGNNPNGSSQSGPSHHQQIGHSHSSTEPGSNGHHHHQQQPPQ